MSAMSNILGNGETTCAGREGQPRPAAVKTKGKERRKSGRRMLRNQIGGALRAAGFVVLSA